MDKNRINFWNFRHNNIAVQKVVECVINSVTTIVRQMSFSKKDRREDSTVYARELDMLCMSHCQLVHGGIFD